MFGVTVKLDGQELAYRRFPMGPIHKVQRSDIASVERVFFDTAKRIPSGYVRLLLIGMKDGADHFTESHLSRLLQLADIHIWCRQFRSLNRSSTSEINQLMIKEIDESGLAMFASKYKEYPLGC